MPGWGYLGGYGWGGWLLMLVTMVVFVGGLVAAAIMVVRGVNRSRSTEDGALRILEERFARGEIDEDEYQRRRAMLIGSGDRGAS